MVYYISPLCKPLEASDYCTIQHREDPDPPAERRRGRSSQSRSSNAALTVASLSEAQIRPDSVGRLPAIAIHHRPCRNANLRTLSPQRYRSPSTRQLLPHHLHHRGRGPLRSGANRYPLEPFTLVGQATARPICARHQRGNVHRPIRLVWVHLASSRQYNINSDRFHFPFNVDSTLESSGCSVLLGPLRIHPGERRRRGTRRPSFLDRENLDGARAHTLIQLNAQVIQC
ncbi:hypothetical protein K438DRAFT_537610 [Mycena galopus ATCC 62051]|nr:hypothetical protein K438DRAFT_537610 [Mycena galopus ATCC 62051]